jgi:hypothetical protein
MHDTMSNCGDAMLLKNAAPAPLEQELDQIGGLRAMGARRPLFVYDHPGAVTRHETPIQSCALDLAAQ